MLALFVLLICLRLNDVIYIIIILAMGNGNENKKFFAVHSAQYYFDLKWLLNIFLYLPGPISELLSICILNAAHRISIKMCPLFFKTLVFVNFFGK